MKKKTIEKIVVNMVLKEQNPAYKPINKWVRVIEDNGQIFLQIEGYGECQAEKGEGCPIFLDIWQGRLRVVVADDINNPDPQIIDLTKAKETHRRE